MKLNFTAFIYESHLSPEGLLPRQKKIEASACWHFCRLAHEILEKVPEQATYEGDLDQTVSLRRVAMSVATMYGITLDNMFAFSDFCHAEAIRLSYPWNPKLQSWLATGGRVDEITREPEALNKS